MRIKLLYFDDCASWDAALTILRQTLNELGRKEEVKLVRVETDQQAEAVRFVGSPTIRVDGQDLFPIEQTNYALGCRIYTTPEGLRGSPTADMIRDAFLSVSARQI